MSKNHTDRNLLVGILALQMDFIDQTQLVAAMQSWILRKSVSLEDVLLDLKMIGGDKKDFLRSIAEKHIELHDNDAEKSLAALSSETSVRKKLQALDDAEVDQTLKRIENIRENSRTSVAAEKLSGPDSTRIAAADRSQRFRILRPHAKGGLGQVSIAEDTELHREVALKEIQDRYSRDPASRSRFMIEAEVTGRLEHPGIVPVYSLGSTDSGCPFYVMRFIRGDSLKEAIERLHDTERSLTSDEHRLELRKLLRRLVDVSDAIEYAHSRGVLHRDLKPGNIMLGKYGETLVVDWGLAKSVGRSANHEHNDEVSVVPESSEGSTETRMGTAVGTLPYMSPEQADGRLNDLGPPSDVYCLGATLYCILTGRAPIPKGPQEEMLLASRLGKFPKPSQVKESVPKALEAICLKAMSFRIADRYQTAARFADEIELWLADEPVTAYEEPWIQRMARWSRRHRTLVTSTVGMLAIAATALLIISGLISRQNTDLRQKNAEIEMSGSVILTQRDSLEENRATLADLSLGVLTAAESGLKNTPGADEFRSTIMERSFDTFKLLNEQDPSNSSVGTSLAQSARLSANQLARTGQRPAAAVRMRLSVELQQGLLISAKDPVFAKNYLAESFRDLGSILRALGQLNKARESFREALQILADLLAAEPASIPLRRTAASIDLTQAGLLIDVMEYESAEILAKRSAAVFLELSAGKDAVPTDHILAMLAIAWHGRVLDLTTRHDEAREVFAVGIARGRDWMKQFPNNLSTEYPYARLLHWDADGVSISGMVSEEIIKNLDEAISICEKVRTAAPASVGFMYNLGDALKTRGRVFRMGMQFDQALECLRKSEEVLQARLKAEDSADSRDILSETLHELSATQLASGDKASGISSLQTAIELLRKAEDLSPEATQTKRKRRQLEELLASLM